MPALTHPIKKRVPEASALALLLLTLLAVWLGSRLVNEASWVRHTLEVQSKISEIRADLQSTEIAQRNFVLTGDETFLTPFRRRRSKLNAGLDNLAQVVIDNPKELLALASARPLIEQRLADADRAIILRQEGKFEEARDQLLSKQSLERAAKLNEFFTEMLAEEERLVQIRSSHARETSKGAALVLGLGLLGLVYALGAWILGARRSAAELARTNTELRRSIADREAAEQQVRQMQKMEAIGQLTGGIAHDFNNMLAVITSGITLAQRRIARGQEGAPELLEGALDGARRAARLISRLLAFSRQQPLSPKPLDANRFVSGMSELVARSLGGSIRMETVLGGGLWPVSVDAAQLEASILNLCVNARDAMPDGGRLTLETANFYLDERYSALHPGVPPGQYVLIAVTDTGFGMDKETTERAFEPFFTTKPAGKGTGLGLPQVYGFVKQSGGHIKIYSEPGQGTTVKIYLPRHWENAPAEVEGRAPPQIVHGTETVLVVEDDAKLLELTAEGLREMGYSVVAAPHANDALAFLAGDGHIDLLLTDIVMPDINGRKLADQARNLRPALKVLYMTGFTRNAIVHNGILDVGVHLLAKPFTLEELSQKVREALNTVVVETAPRN
ncbi:CHASE3 domain-containing protein [Hyphomicrobium sp.]|uniref:CHASE3 domain-containing protein n=1 Tax=Hyphomicrobium sp. TaxID=82 RepID=UPI002D784CBD|nr:CHASE3 domain-containing protein [Hyphomicrobium sp.]HET6389761.1 CHASE3 domain-containing protein [Hyphomicrobium sp.]